MDNATASEGASAVHLAAGQTFGKSILGVAWREVVRKAIRALFHAAARFRRLVCGLARRAGIAITAMLRPVGSLANIIRIVLSSRPARVLIAAAASVICISLQYRRPKVADIQLSSSISLLFGMVKLQGSVALQFGPPESGKAEQQQQPAASQNDELRINCPKDVRESIVRFLESQAARNHDFNAQPPASAASIHQTTPLSEHQHKQLPVDDADEKGPRNINSACLQPQEPLLLSPQDKAAESVAASLNSLWGPCPERLSEAVAGAAVREDVGYDTAESAFATEMARGGGCGFESCGSEPLSEVVANAAAGAAATAAVPSHEELLPSTPPLGGSPPATAAGCLGGSGGVHLQEAGQAVQRQPQPPASQSLFDLEFLAALGPAEEPPALDTSDCASLMSYAALYKSSIAPLTVNVATGDGPHDRGLVARGGLHDNSPDSILGLRQLGIEGWAESSRRWESRYLEE